MCEAPSFYSFIPTQSLPMSKILMRMCVAGLISLVTVLPGYTQVLPEIRKPIFKKDTFNVTEYGAKADGITLNTKSISEAISACSKKGGGVVLVPHGLWLTGPLVLQSNINLCIEKDAVLQFTADFDQYRLIESSYEGLPAYRNQAPISAVNAENIAITGEGIIDGNGGAWRIVNRDRQSDIEWNKLVASGGIISKDGELWYPSEKSMRGSQIKNAGVITEGKTAKGYEDIKDYLRPNLLVFNNCKSVLLQGVTFQNSPAWCLHLLLCDQITVRNIIVKNPWYAQNGDGIDIESCTNVLVEGSTFDVGDDGICIKSGRDEAGRKRGKPTMNVLVRSCIVYHAHGGFVIGSEMSGGAKNIYVQDCTFMGTDIGLRFKTTRGRGGVVENIYISNINMKDIVNEAILFDMYYFAKPPSAGPEALTKEEIFPVTEATPRFRNFFIDSIVCMGASKAVFIRGLPEMNIANVNMSNIVIQATKGIDCIEAAGIAFKNVQLITKETAPVINVLNSNTITFDNIRFNENANVLLALAGERCKNIKLLHTDTGKAKTPVFYGAGTSKDVLVKE
jgi:polygalacturonase